MCFGGPKPPKVKYQGSFKDDIRRQEESLARYERQIEQQQTFQTQLQAQIDEANAQTAALQEQYASELKAAEASGAAAIGFADTMQQPVAGSRWSRINCSANWCAHGDDN